MSSGSSTTRRIDIDWLRVLSILTIFIFHSGRFFDTIDWHVKNTRQYDLVTAWTAFLAAWIMPLIFVVSAASTFYALGSRSIGVFLKDRALRLLVPLIIGVLTHIALQVYLDELTHHGFSGSFWAFYPHYFDMIFSARGGNVAINPTGLFYLLQGKHLWYLQILFIFSVIFLPLLAWLRSDTGRQAYEMIGNIFGAPGAIYLLAIPLIGTALLSRDNSLILNPAPYANWSLLAYAQFFLYGFVITTHEQARRSVERGRWLSLVTGILTTAGLLFTLAASGSILSQGQSALLTGVLFALSGWLWVLAVLGFGARRLTRPTPLLSYANEAVLPFYVLHQSMLIVIGYSVVSWPIPDVLKFVVIAGSSFGLIMIIYEYLIRRVNLLRFIFGMHALPRQAQARVVSETA